MSGDKQLPHLVIKQLPQHIYLHRPNALMSFCSTLCHRGCNLQQNKCGKVVKSYAKLSIIK